MIVSFIGSGNVATHFARAFKKSGFEIGEIWSRSFTNSTKLAEEINAKAIQNIGDLKAADLLIIAVKDDAIPTVLSELNIGDTRVVHTSGATSIEVFKGKYVNYGVLYPLQTFSSQKYIDFSTVPICVEANSESNLNDLKTTALKVSTEVREINSEQRLALHLAAVFVCNFTNYLYQAGAELLADQGLEFNLLRPLIIETADKIKLNKPQDMQTGPAKRGDLQTMEKHLNALNQHPQLRELYKLISTLIKKSNP